MLVVLAFAVLLLSATAGANNPVTGAGFTTTNTSVAAGDGTGHCKNGNEDVNCNIYDGKQYVWLNGGPNTAYVGDGTYFFAVLEPGGQSDPNDASPVATDQNLSDDFDAYTNRTFSVTGGTVDYLGSHDFDSNKIRLADYSDTTNPGGVYILAICSLANGYPVAANSCKYDAFKVKEGEVVFASAPTITKGADGTNENTYKWTIDKAADKTLVKQVGGSVTFTYTVTVSHDAGTIGAVKVKGTISVFNSNVDGSNNTVPVDIDGVTDTLSDSTACTVTGGGAQTLSQYQTDFPYECSLGGLPQGQLDNKASVGWPAQFLSNGTILTDGSADVTFTNIAFTENTIDECVTVTDTYAVTLGQTCVGDLNPHSFHYQRIISVLPGCHSYDNTATFTTNDTGATGSDPETVTVCGPSQTGALTIGFWKTTNGQNLVKTYCVNGAASLATYLKGLGAGTGPFSDAPTTTCGALATYVYNILKNASATNMNVMLKAQMLGTALDVWFSGPGWTSGTLSNIKPPSKFLSHNNLGTFNMDTTSICPMIDNLSTGTATCKNNTPSTNAVAAGALPISPMTIQAILDYASTTPSPFNGSTSASVWYAGDRTKQEILKNVFDQFNNQDAFGSF